MKTCSIRSVLHNVFFAAFLFIAVSANAQPDYTFKGGVLTSGTDLAVGAVYKFTGVKPGTNANVTILGMSGGITLTDIDNNTTGFDEAFQPFIDVPPNSNGYVTFRIDFVNPAGNPKNQSSVPVSCIDIDGTGYGNGNLFEQDSIQYQSGFYNFSPMTTNIQITNPGGLGGFVVAKNTTGISLPGIDTVDRSIMFTVTSNNISSIIINVGARNTSPTKGEIRFRSVYFKNFTYPGSVLSSPKLIGFNGNENNNKVNLNWSFETLSGLDHVELERSNSKGMFNSIADFMITSDLNNRAFNYTDNLTTTGKFLYRLKMVGSDGSVKYSSILAFSNDAQAGNNLQVYPTMVTDHFNVKVSTTKSQNGLIKLYDLSGKMVYKQQVTMVLGSNNISVNDFRASKGNYVVVMTTDDNQSYNSRIVIQ